MQGRGTSPRVQDRGYKTEGTRPRVQNWCKTIYINGEYEQTILKEGGLGAGIAQVSFLHCDDDVFTCTVILIDAHSMRHCTY